MAFSEAISLAGSNVEWTLQSEGGWGSTKYSKGGQDTCKGYGTENSFRIIKPLS